MSEFDFALLLAIFILVVLVVVADRIIRRLRLERDTALCAFTKRDLELNDCRKVNSELFTFRSKITRACAQYWCITNEAHDTPEGKALSDALFGSYGNG